MMVMVGRTVTTFLDSRYSDEGTEVAQKELTKVARNQVDVMRASVAGKRRFNPPKPPKRTTMRIQYDAKIEEIDSISDYLGDPGMSGSDVGRHTFNFFLRNEVGEE